MAYYLIKEALVPCVAEELRGADNQFVVVVGSEEWARTRDSFDMVIDMEMDTVSPLETKAEVNMDSLTGTFVRPELNVTKERCGSFAFALDEKGIVLVDDTGFAEQLVERVRRTRKWRLPSLERFIYDLLEETIAGDLTLFEEMEKRLSAIEDDILADQIEGYPPEMGDIRSDLLDLRVHYEQLIDLGQELQENENGFFLNENLRYFHMFTERVVRLQDMVSSQRDYVGQLRDLMQSQLDIKQNRIMTVLTVVTSIFLPLTLIAGWYGMNFRYMPELGWEFSYPLVFLVSVVIVVVCLVWFKRKRWL